MQPPDIGSCNDDLTIWPACVDGFRRSVGGASVMTRAARRRGVAVTQPPAGRPSAFSAAKHHL